MRVWPEWILLVMCVLHPVTGKLYKPLNITTESRNFCLFLTWLPALKNPPNVTYNVYYKFISKKSWKEVPGCRGILKTECDLTHVLQKNYSNLHMVRVRAISETQNSAWSNLSNISYMFTVDPAPPILHIMQDTNAMMINVTLQQPPCMLENLNIFMEYWLEITNINNPSQKLPQMKLNKYTTTVRTAEYNGEYCIAVRTKYTPETTKQKISQPSNTICLHFMQQDQIHHAKLLIVLLLLPIALIVVVTIYIFWCITTPKTKIPKVLIPDKKYPVMVLEIIDDEDYNWLTIVENVKESSSTTLLSNTDKDYPFNNCGYAARQPMQDYRLRRNIGESTSDEYSSSSCNKSSSDSSCIQTSESSTKMALRQEKIQCNNQSKDIDTITLGNTETLVPKNMDMHPLLDTLHVKNFTDIPLNTLSLNGGTNHLEYSDNDSYDFEEAQEQASSHCADRGTSDSYTGPIHIHLQNNCSSGYEKHSYMLRRC